MVTGSHISLLMPPAKLNLFMFSPPIWLWLISIVALYYILSAIGFTLFHIHQGKGKLRKCLKVTLNGWSLSFAAQLLSLLTVFCIYHIILGMMGFNGFTPGQSSLRIVFLAAAILLAGWATYLSLMHIALKKEVPDIRKRRGYALFMASSIGLGFIVFNWTGAYSWLVFS